MYRLSIAIVVVAGFALLAPLVSAQCGKSCSAGKNVASAQQSPLANLNASWKEAIASAQGMDAEKRQELHQRMSTLKDSCPVGSRMGDTFSAINGTLSMIVDCCDADSECCAAAKSGSASESGMDEKALAEMKALADARTSTLTQLRELSGYMALCTSDKSSCKSAQACDSAAATQSCKVACPIELASNLGALKASWKTAHTEVLALTAEQKQHIADGLASVSSDCKVMALVPQTVFAISDGLEKLDGIHTQMMEWGKKNSEFMASVPKDKMQSFYMQTALTREARGVLAGMSSAMKAFGDCASEKGCPSAGQTKEAAQID